jgi:hypothetical protein
MVYAHICEMFPDESKSKEKRWGKKRAARKKVDNSIFFVPNRRN